MTTRVLVLIEEGLYLEALVDVLGEVDPAMVADIADPASADDIEGLALAAPDVLLVDVDRFGEGAVTRLEALVRRLPDTRVIGIGSADGAPTIERILAAGAAGYLPRRFTRLATLAVLRLALNSGSAPVPGAASDDPLVTAGDASRRATLRRLGLTERETRVLALAAEGKTNAAIAHALGTAEGTVRIQMSSILSKLNVTNRSEAIIVALRMQRVVWEQIRMAEQGDLDLGALLPHMEHRAHRVNDVLFRMNDVGKELYYLQQGRVRLPELGLEMKERDVFGELGLFATGHRRTSSAVCATDVDLFVMSEVKAKQMYFLNPAFAMYMVNLVSQRLVAQRGPPGTASNGA